MAADLLCELSDEPALKALSNAAENDIGKDCEGRAVAEAAREASASIQQMIKTAG